jgi:hypothetical protein
MFLPGTLQDTGILAARSKHLKAACPPLCRISRHDNRVVTGFP